MKRIRTIALGLALCSALSACSRFVPSSYTRVSAHSQTKSEQMDTNVVNVGDYAGLRRAIRDFVRGGVEHGLEGVRVMRARNGNGLGPDCAGPFPKLGKAVDHGSSDLKAARHHARRGRHAGSARGISAERSRR